MAKIKIDKDKLSALRDYFLNGGSTDHDDVAEQLGTDEQAVIQAYVQALRETYPSDFPPAEATSANADDNPDFFLVGADGLLQQIVIQKEKPGKIIFKIKEPEEKVEVLVKGTVREIDLYQLRKNPSGETFGVSNAVLISLGEIAKG